MLMKWKGTLFFTFLLYAFCVRIAFVQADGWVNVGTPGFPGTEVRNPSIAIHPMTHEPYVAYIDVNDNYRTAVMRYDGSSWLRVGSGGLGQGGSNWFTINSVKIAFNPSTNQPYIAFIDYHEPTYPIIVKRFNGSDWLDVDQTYLNATGQASEFAFAFNPATAEPYLALRYNDDQSTFLRYSHYYNGSEWVDGWVSMENPLTTSDPRFVNLSFNPVNNRAYVHYWDYFDITEHVKRFDGTTWLELDEPEISQLASQDWGRILLNGYADLPPLSRPATELVVAYHPITKAPYIAFLDDNYGGRLVVMKYVIAGNSQINLDINSTIALSCDPNVTMNAIVGTGKSAINDNNQADCTVITNNSAGYALSWQASSDDLLNSQSDHFAAYSPAASTTPEIWDISNTTSAWGAKLASTSEGYNGGIGGSGYTYPGDDWGSDDSYSNGKFLNVATAPFQIMEKATETDFDGETQSVMFGAEIGADKLQPTGTYTANVTITAVTLSGSVGGGGGGSGGSANCTTHSASYGETVSGTLDALDCQEDPYGGSGLMNYYVEKIQFSGTSGDQIILDSSWASSSGYLYLEDDSNHSIIWHFGHGSIPLNDTFYLSLPTTGTYTLWVTTYSPLQVGDYTIGISLNSEGG